MCFQNVRFVHEGNPSHDTEHTEEEKKFDNFKNKKNLVFLYNDMMGSGDERHVI